MRAQTEAGWASPFSTQNPQIALKEDLARQRIASRRRGSPAGERKLITPVRILFFRRGAAVISCGRGERTMLIAQRAGVGALGSPDVQNLDTGRGPDLPGDSGSLIWEDVCFGHHNSGSPENSSQVKHDVNFREARSRETIPCTVRQPYYSDIARPGKDVSMLMCGAWDRRLQQPRLSRS
jgi:hypothetical protein